MPKVICPNCGSLATGASLIRGRKYYCAQCGWNVDIAQAELRSSIKAASGVAALGALLAVVALIRNPGDRAPSVMLMVTFLGLPGAWSLGAWNRLRKLRVFPAANVKKGPAPNTISSKNAYNELADLARPRKIRTTWQGRLYFALALLAVGLWTYFGVPAMWNGFRDTRATNTWGLVAASVVIYGYSFGFFRNRLRERQLLVNGELASGHIVKQTNGRYNQRVEYAFKDAAGKTIMGRSIDASRSLYEGMSTPVFYDPIEPKRNISLDCSLTKLDTW
jgi:hypothetical protein